MGGCAKVLFWLIIAAVMAVFVLLDNGHRVWAAVVFVVALGLTVAYQGAETEGW